jgi:hypothetical protein
VLRLIFVRSAHGAVVAHAARRCYKLSSASS